MMAALTSTMMDFSSRPYAQDPSAPDPVRPHAGALSAGDALDDLFNYDAGVDDTFRDAANSNNNTTDTDAAIAARRRAAREEDGDLSDAGAKGLGIDEVVKVRKARAPIAKLDEGRLLGDKGIPKLRKITKERLRFKGKGHEYSDVARLLSTYQLWLDDLFPKAKFADGLTIIEKLGHSRHLQVMRKEWIEEGKPKPAESEPSDDEYVASLPADGAEAASADANPSNANASTNEQGQVLTEGDDSQVVDDLYAPPSLHFAPSKPSQANDAEDGPEGDELDQLLAEDAQARERSQSPRHFDIAPPRDDFADDEEAMASMDW